MKVLKWFVIPLALFAFSISMQSCKDEAPCIDAIVGTYIIQTGNVLPTWIDVEISRGENDGEAIVLITWGAGVFPEYTGKLNDNCSVIRIPTTLGTLVAPQLDGATMIFEGNKMIGYFDYETVDDIIYITAEK